jgi:pimeloyl-ACP methyl ester carboxylesterase
MNTVTSADGTTIGYDRTGDGPPVILVDGAFCGRSFGPMPGLATLLAERFTVYTYDRRGRGDSGDTEPYAIEREIEDLEALIDAAGGSAHLFGISSGAVLAARAAAALPGKVRRLAIYEPPVVVDSSRAPVPADYRQHIAELVAAGRNGDVVKYFMTAGVGLPAIFVVLMRLMPAWSKLKAAAPSLRYDAAVMGDSQAGKPLPEELRKVLGGIDVPALVADGGKSPAWIRNGVQAVADAVPESERRTLPGQTHQVKAAAVAPVLVDFFSRETGETQEAV